MNPATALLPDAHAMARGLRSALPQFTYVNWKDETASTNLDLLSIAHTHTLGRPYLQGAYWQTQGRGRVGRVWQNQPGTCLMFSCAFDVSLAPMRLPMLSPLSGMAACAALRALLAPECRHDLQVKWPNDVLWRGAKLAGILVETKRIPGMRGHIVVMGMGMNWCNAPALSLALGRDVADWSQIVHSGARAAAMCAQHLVAQIAKQWEEDVRHVQTHGADDFIQQYAHMDALAGKTVHILDQGSVALSGLACGINHDGQLLVQTRDGRTCPVTVGEVSVRTP